MKGRRNDWLGKGILLSVLILGIILARGLESRAEQKPVLAILPFFVERTEDPARGTVLCPLCKGLYRYGEVVPGSQYTLTRLLQGKMEALERFHVLPSEKVEGVLSPWMKKQLEEKPIPPAIEVGKELGADFILVGYLFRFEERVGSSIGADKPASVGFDVHLLRLRGGIEVWRGKFDETQKPLSENLLKMGSFLRRKASWLTAEELAGVGIDEMLKNLPETKELEMKRSSL